MIDELRHAALVAIGDELVCGETLDTNSAWLSERLAEIGIEVCRFTLVGDDEPALERLFYELASEFQIVVATGGLGPTEDDVTRHAAARAAGVALELSKEVEEELRARWTHSGREMPAANLRQALFPQGAQIIPNTHGTAPGFRVWIDGGCLMCLPGPPREMRAMVEAAVVPWIAKTCGVQRVRRLARFYLFGLPESGFAELAGDWMERGAEPRLGVCAREGVLTARLWSEAATAAEAERRLARRSAELRERFAPWLYSESEPDLARLVGRELLRRGITIATAESCTGGLVAARLTDVPGISAVFREGWVTYSNEAKVERLGVPAELLGLPAQAGHRPDPPADSSRGELDAPGAAAPSRAPDAPAPPGAVSAEVARAMASGAAARSGARIAVATTGIAGPEGGTPEKPVGLVWFGLCVDGVVQAFERRFPVRGRDLVKSLSVQTALDLVRRHMPEA